MSRPVSTRSPWQIAATLVALLSLVVTGLVVTTPTSAAAQSPSTWRQVAAGGFHTCGIKTDRTLWCWGWNQSGQLGHGAGSTRTPTQVGTQANWAWVTVGYRHSCGLKTNGERFCWGNNGHGQLGLTGGNRQEPIRRLDEGGVWAYLHAGNNHTCGVRTNGRLYCWGHNRFGQLGLGDTTDRTLPQLLPLTGWTTVSAGGYHTCGLRGNGQRWCWGDNIAGGLGLGDRTGRTVPTMPGLDVPYLELAAGYDHTCGRHAVLPRLYCWGLNSSGQLGDGGATNHRTEPVLIASNVLSVTAGQYHTCVLSSDRLRFCTGANSYGELGLRDTTGRSSFVAASGEPTWQHLAAGWNHTCGIDVTGILYCWGRNDEGQLGWGYPTHRDRPVLVLG